MESIWSKIFKVIFRGCITLIITFFIFFVGACVRINSEGALIKDLKERKLLIKRRTIDLDSFYMIGSGPSEVTYMRLYPYEKSRSKYINISWNILVPISSFGYAISANEVLKNGYEFYLLTNLIFDKEKGNDFKEMEKILDEYSKEYTKIYASSKLINYGFLKGRYKKNEAIYQYFKENGELVYKETSITYEEFKEKEKENKKKYYELYDEYFKEPRQFETMNWDEFGEKLSYFPVLDVVLKCKECDLSNKEESEKEIYDRLKKYHNPKTYKLYVYVKKENK